MLFVQWPDVNLVKKGPERAACLEESEYLYSIMQYLLYFHTYALVNTFYRENFESGIGNTAQIMRFLETSGSMVYVGLITISINIYCKYYLWKHGVFDDDPKMKECIGLPHVRGRVNDWLTIEIMVYIFYLLTMLILMFKSRFILIGIDQSK